MSNLNIRNDETLNNILHISCKLVVLQNLKICYEYELNTDLAQEIRNFRSCCILDEIKSILDELTNHVEWIANISLGNIPCPQGQEENINRLVSDLDLLYRFTLEESSKKEARLNLMELERKMFNEK